MKTLFTLLVLFFSSTLFAEVYYCVEENATGFDGGNNYKNTVFDEIKFTGKIDFEKLIFESKDLIFNTTMFANEVCVNGWRNNFMQCMNGEGASIVFNKKNLNFVYSQGFGYVHDKKNTDDLILSYGKCSKF